jgi:hypothetical protein
MLKVLCAGDLSQTCRNVVVLLVFLFVMLGGPRYVFSSLNPPDGPKHNPCPQKPDKECTDNQINENWWRWLTKDPVADATMVLAAVTGILAFVSIFQIRLSRREFIATHRPRIRVRGLHIADPNGDVTGDPVVVMFFAHNVGETPATLTGVMGTIHITRNTTAPLPANLAFGYRQQLNIILSAGEQEIFMIEDGTIVPEAMRTAVYTGDRPLYCIGAMQYRDDNGVERTTGFCRRFYFRPPRSETETNSEYEYEY